MTVQQRKGHLVPVVSSADVLAEALSAKSVAELSASKGEPQWMLAKRLDALQTFASLPLPEWRRTNVSGLKLDGVQRWFLPEPSVESLKQLPRSLRRGIGKATSRSGLLVQEHSSGVYAQLDESLVRQGVIFTDLDTALREHPELVQEHYQRAARPGQVWFLTHDTPSGEGKFDALHGALWSGGVFLYVPRGVEIALPVEAHFWASDSGVALFPHTLIIAEAGSTVTYIERYDSSVSGGQVLHCGGVEVYAKDGAKVRFLTIQDWGKNVWEFVTKRAFTERDAEVFMGIVALGAKLSRTALESVMLGPGGGSQTVGMFFGEEDQHQAFFAALDHVGLNTLGDVLFRGVLKDRARSVFEGLARVEHGAVGTNSYMADHALLLSEQARADAIPSLEIMCNEVRCTHGTTCGQIDEEQLFYLASRGVPEAEAVRLIVAGFYEQNLKRIPSEALRERARRALQGRLSRV